MKKVFLIFCFFLFSCGENSQTGSFAGGDTAQDISTCLDAWDAIASLRMEKETAQTRLDNARLNWRSANSELNAHSGGDIVWDPKEKKAVIEYDSSETQRELSKQKETEAWQEKEKAFSDWKKINNDLKPAYYQYENCLDKK